jgi:hypothetical protein
MTELLCEDLLSFHIFVVAGKGIFVFVQLPGCLAVLNTCLVLTLKAKKFPWQVNDANGAILMMQ